MNRSELLSRILTTGSENITHATRVVSDSLGHTVDCAELWWNVAILTVDLDDEQWLTSVGNLHVVSFQEVLSDAHLLAILSLKTHGDGILVEIDINDDVGPLVPVLTDDSLVLELVQNARLLVLDIWGTHDLVDPL